MNKDLQIDDGGKLMLSCSYLKKQGIQPKTIEMWAMRGKDRLGSYYYYEPIPTPTKNKLPPKDELFAMARAGEKAEAVNIYLKKMTWCSEKGFLNHMDYYKKTYNVNDAKALEAARLHSVWQYILDLKKNEGCRDSKGLHAAFNQIFPNKYPKLPSFCNAVSKATKDGVEAVSKKDSWFTAPNNVPRVSDLNKFFVAGIIAHGKKFNATETWKKICADAKEKDMEPPSLRWVQMEVAKLKKNPVIYSKRYGNEVANQLPYASLEQAMNANSQWQADAFTIPIFTRYELPNGKFKTVRFGLSMVKDAHSHKILGYSLNRSEDTQSIMAAYRHAIYSTKEAEAETFYLPFEIVTDNHSANQTETLGYFTEVLKKIGTTYTIDSNPRRKVVIERDNKYLSAIFKEMGNSVGESVKAIGKDARAKQELITDYFTHGYTIEETENIVSQVVKNFNETVLAKRGKSPNQLYEESQKPHCFKIDLFGLMQLVVPKREMKIRNGQIKITKGFAEHEFQLDANLISKYNGDSVFVRYINLNEGISIYEKATDKKIGFIRPKQKIYAALADQTAHDKELLYQNTGRIKGYKNTGKKQLKELSIKAHEIDSDAYGSLSAMLTDKQTLAAAEESANLKMYGSKQRRILEDIDENEADYFKPVEKKSKGVFTQKTPKNFGYYVPPIED